MREANANAKNQMLGTMVRPRRQISVNGISKKKTTATTTTKQNKDTNKKQNKSKQNKKTKIKT